MSAVTPVEDASNIDIEIESLSAQEYENEQRSQDCSDTEKSKRDSEYQANPVMSDSSNSNPHQSKTLETVTVPPHNCIVGRSLRFGWGRISGKCLQKFNNPLCFLICVAFAALSQGFVVTGIAFGAITSIERQFGYTSSEVAMFTLAYEVAFGIMSVILGYFGNIHKPRFTALSLLVLAGGAAIIAIPKFVKGTYIAAIERTTDFCLINATNKVPLAPCIERDLTCTVIFTIGFILMGFGASPLWTLIPAHIEEVKGRRSSSIYNGIYFGTSAIGPALGFIVGQPILNKWVDLDAPPATITPSNRNWVGAWWLGFLLGAGLLLLPVLPLFAFPKEFPDTHLLRKKREAAEDCAARDDTLKSDLKSVWPALRALLTNPPYIFVSLAIASETCAVGGFTAFLAKFVQVQFHATDGNSALYTGAMIIPGAVVGVKLGGYLLSRYDWDCRQILRFCSFIGLVSALCLVIVFVGCDGRRVVGQIDQSELSYGSHSAQNFSSSCNADCGCTPEFYKPICSAEDQKTYYSPCYAGCPKNDSRMQPISIGDDGNSYGSKDLDSEQDQFYYNCSCFAPNVTHAVRGACTDECTLLPLFAVGMVITMLLTFLNNIPLLQTLLRVANAGQGSFALGLGQVFMRFLGFVPGPIMVGALIDASCVMSQPDDCSGATRNCLEYNQPNFRYYMFTGGIVMKMLSFVFILLAYKTYRLPNKTTPIATIVGKVNHAVENDVLNLSSNAIKPDF